MSTPEIQTLDSQIVYRNRWMTVREDRIQRADGSPGLYGVVEKAHFAIIAALHEGCLQMVEQYRYPVRQRFWELPQGAWETREVDPLTLATAELREETGWTAGRMQHAGELFLAYGFCTQTYNVFFATDLQPGERQLDAEEQGLVCRAIPVETVQAMILDGTIRDASTVAAFGLLRLKGWI